MATGTLKSWARTMVLAVVLGLAAGGCGNGQPGSSDPEEQSQILVAAAADRPSVEDLELHGADNDWIGSFASVHKLPKDVARVRAAQESIIMDAVNLVYDQVDGGQADLWVSVSERAYTVHVRSANLGLLDALTAAAEQAGAELILEGPTPIAWERQEQLSEFLSDRNTDEAGLSGYYVDLETGRPVLDIVRNPSVDPAATQALLDAVTEYMGISPEVNWLPDFAQLD